MLVELERYNPELMGKSRILAITKSDLLDEELTEALSADLPDDLPCRFISSVTGQGITELKDLLWQELNRETFHDADAIVHRDMDMSLMADDDEAWDIPPEEADDDADADLEFDWEEEYAAANRNIYRKRRMPGTCGREFPSCTRHSFY